MTDYLKAQALDEDGGADSGSLNIAPDTSASSTRAPVAAPPPAVVNHLGELQNRVGTFLTQLGQLSSPTESLLKSARTLHARLPEERADSSPPFIISVHTQAFGLAQCLAQRHQPCSVPLAQNGARVGACLVSRRLPRLQARGWESAALWPRACDST